MSKEKKQIAICIPLSQELLDELNAFCDKKYGITKTVVVRAALKKFLAEEKKK